MRSLSILLVVLVFFSYPVFAQDEILVPEPILFYIGSTVDDSAGGNGNGILEPGESVLLVLNVYNAGTATAWGVNGTLRTDEIDVTITDRKATFGDVEPGDVLPSLSPHFAISVASSVPCGKDLTFELQLAGTNLNVTHSFTQPMTDLEVKDMAQFVEDVIIYGIDDADETGYSVASGDLNGDGYADLIMGAPYGQGPGNTGSTVGEVWILYGEASLDSTIYLNAPPAQSTIIYGEGDNRFLGYTITVGDMNGDGYDDLILGAPHAEGPGGRTSSGEVWFIFGGSNMANTDVIDLSAPPSYCAVIYGADTFDYAGGSVSFGDINGDLLDDIIIGAPEGDGPGNARSNAGEIWILFETLTSLTNDLSTPPESATVIYGAEEDDNAGWSIATGDVNADGYEDVIVAVRSGDGPSNFRSNCGEIWIIYGSDTLGAQIDLASPPPGSTLIFGPNTGDGVHSVACGDVNGDGFDDIVLSNNGDGPDGFRFDAGEVWVIAGGPSLDSQIDLSLCPDNTALIFGQNDTDILGKVSTGDINGDGYDDILVAGQRGDGPDELRDGAGEVWVIYGSSTLFDAIDLAIPPGSGMVVYGADVYDYAGANFHYFSGRPISAGDVNGDGYDDLFIGVTTADGYGNTGTDVGEIAVVYGKPTFHYYVDTATYAWIDATTGTDIGLTCDSCCMEVDLGFSFEFYGQPYSSVWICDDGYISFEPVVAPDPWNYCLPDQHEPNNIVAAFWDDLNGEGASGVWTLLQGSSPNQRFTVQWAGVPYYPTTGDSTFEITLYEGSNQIIVQYQDTIFGSGADNGLTATAGVENAIGVAGQSFSCFAPNLLDSTAWRAIPFGTYQLYYDDMESGVNGWTVSGSPQILWHQESTSCSPHNRSPVTSWYYGETSTCSFDIDAVNYGQLLSPALDFDFYSHLYHWFRRDTNGQPDEHLSFIQIAEDGGPFSDLEQIFDEGYWQPHVNDISAHSNHSLEVGFFFDSVVDDVLSRYTGWMIDDVAVWGCDVYGSKAMKAYAYAVSSPTCETSSFLLDGSGSYALGCSSVTYQWFEDGSPIIGATTLQYTVPAGHTTGTYAYTLEITCASPLQTEVSDPIYVEVVPMPVEVPEDSFMLTKTGGGTSIHMNWTNVNGGDAYHIYQDTNPDGTFNTLAGQAPSGVTGLDITLPPDNLVCYLVAGYNDTCGEGPKK